MKKVGILGGGQLGRMLLQASANYVVETYILENDEHCPSAHLCHHFVKGDIRNFDDVYNFAKHLDALTIEIESVNVDALEKLESEGVKVYPKASVIRTIKNKVIQKEFYRANEIPTADFVITQSHTELKNYIDFLPAVHKIGEGGYDGRGVQVMRNEMDLEKGFDAPSVLEKMIHVNKEIALIVAVGDNGQTVVYPPVEMIFNPHLNLLDYQICPASIDQNVVWKAEAISIRAVKSLHSAGIFAVELFVNGDEVLVNEMAPRVHNSGHHTIEAAHCSQFDMLWRIMLNLPLGNTKAIISSALINVLGSEGHSGNAQYEGLDEILKMDNAFVHLYGKTETKPGRKMGHVTLIGNDRQDLEYNAQKLKHKLKVISN